MVDRPVCAACNDTHRMPWRDGGQVPCTQCPLPCIGCGNGRAFCAVTPCCCECHAVVGATKPPRRVDDPLKEPCHDCRMPSEGWENTCRIRFCVQCAVRWRAPDGGAIDFSGDSVDVDRRYYLAQWSATAKRERAVREQLNATLEAAHQIEGALRDALTWMGQVNDGDTEERRRIIAAGWAALEGR